MDTFLLEPGSSMNQTISRSFLLFHRLMALIALALLLNGCGELAYKRGASGNDLSSDRAACKSQDPTPAAVEKCLANKGWTVQRLDKLEPIDVDPVIDAAVIPSDQRIENIGGYSGATQHPAGNVAPAAAATPPKKMPDPLDKFTVSSWWKMGGNANDLEEAMTACATALGEAHAPDTTKQHVTRGLLLCMKEKGWSGLRAK
jgi:hypothetical protein